MKKNHFTQVTAQIILHLAKAFYRLRPLNPYGGWHFSVAEKNPTLGTRIRKKIWLYCKHNKVQKPIVVSWYSGTKIHLYLGNDMSRMLFVGGCVDPNEFYLLNKIIKPGMTFIDVGANVGLYTLFGSKKVGSEGLVISIEPSQREFDRLKANLVINQAINVNPHKVALFNKRGSDILKVAECAHEGHNTLGEFCHKVVKPSHTEQIVLKRLDDLIIEENINRVDIIKIDVEGSEYSVLDGAQKLLKSSRPLLLIELFDPALRTRGKSVSELLSFLRSLKYQIYSFDKAKGKLIKTCRDVKLSDNIVAAHKDSYWKELEE